MSYEISLIKLVENRDTGLYGRLITISEKAQPLLSYTHGKFPYYTPHDFSHSAAVEENLNWLIPDQVKQDMHNLELFFLIIAAWLHDWGLIGEANEDAELIRATHHIRTENKFEELYEKLNLSEQEARIIGRISKGHRTIDLNSVEYDDIVFGQNAKIRRRFLAALLRIADECDITHNRTPEVIYCSIHPKEDSEVEFNKHLSITGIGQLAEAHKIYISAIARDPKGARTLRQVAQKIQNELDSVKAILAENNVPIDTVELRLETRGFIDKPIAFEIDREKIVQLLIGDHLYANQDVAIRELVQNSLDSCRLRQILEPNTFYKISLHKKSDNTLVIEDNGLGMDFIEAKNFLSTIGSSFHNSEAFMQRFAQADYSPIALHGIGLLSCFLICNQMTIETCKENQEPCKFTIESIGQEWRYEKGSLSNPGTRINLKLNNYGQNIHLRESLERYFLCPEIPIEYSDGDEAPEFLHSGWTGDNVLQRFNKFTNGAANIYFHEIINLTADQYDLILGTCNLSQHYDLFLFNHGIYICGFGLSGFGHTYCLAVNIRADLVDLHISREDVQQNKRWYDFLSRLFDNVFRSLEAKYGSEGKSELIDTLSSMLSESIAVNYKSAAAVLEVSPFIKSFFYNAPFMMLSNGKIESVRLNNIMVLGSISLYNCFSQSVSDEINLITRLSNVSSLVINPYQLLFMPDKASAKKNFYLLSLFLTEAGVRYHELDLRILLLERSTVIESACHDLLPKNVCLAKFPKGIMPLVVVYKYPVVETGRSGFRGADLGDILLRKEFFSRFRLESYFEDMDEIFGKYYEEFKIIEEPTVYIDQSDTFVKALLSANQRMKLNAQISDKVIRYFKYLSYLPFVTLRKSNCIILLWAIDQLENEISIYLNIKVPPPLFERMKPNSKIFLKYFNKFSMYYETMSSS